MQPIFDSLLGYSFLSTETQKPQNLGGHGSQDRESTLVGASDLNMNKSWYSELKI